MPRRFSYAALSSLLLALSLGGPAKADNIENLVFTGTAIGFCSVAGCVVHNGPVTGHYTFDATTTTVLGSWSFSTPFGVLGSSDPGANGGVGFFPAGTQRNYGAYYLAIFEVGIDPIVSAETVEFYFLPTDSLLLGPLGLGGLFIAYDNSEWNVSGSNALAVGKAPEPSGMILAGIGILGLAGLANLRKRRLIEPGQRSDQPYATQI